MALSSRLLLRRVLLGGLIAGRIDIGAAGLISGLGLITILQAVASGVLGRASFRAGLPAAALGLALQWAMSILSAAIFVVASRSLLSLRGRWLAAGVAFGVAIFVVMNYAVLALSAVGHAPHLSARSFAENMLALLSSG